MEQKQLFVKDGIFTLWILISVFVINLIIEKFFKVQTLIPMISVLGVFLVSLKTNRYLWGITAAIFSVFIVNYAFTFPYYAFNFSLPENLISAIIMIIVAIITSTLTTKIKEQEKMRAESEKETMRANLLRAISHDLRTPLTSIDGSISTILENYDAIGKEQQIKMLREICEDSKSLIRMVENLLSVTRIGGENVQLTKTSVVLEELIDSTLQKFHKRYPKQQVTVSIPNEFICVPMDALLIEQVIINLLENAVFHAIGMTELSLTVYTSKRMAVFEIADNGCGIAPDRLHHLFSGYLSHTPNTPADGTRRNMGIGLSVCATIIRAHGKTLQVERRESGGTLFRFSLEMESNSYGQQ